MLSNKADTNPSPSVDCHEGGGSVATGIIDAQITSDNRNALLLSPSGSSCQSGRRIGAQIKSPAHAAAPITGNRSSAAGNARFVTTVVTMMTIKMNATTATRVQSIAIAARSLLTIGAYVCCWRAAIRPL